MALQATSLTAAITASQITFGVTSTVAFPPVGTPFVNQAVLIDSEFMVCVGVPAINTIMVRSRGTEGTVATAHDILSNVYTTANNADWGQLPAGVTVTIDPTDDQVVSVGQDGAIPLPGSNTVVNINKATALAGTLAAPSLVDNGLALVITSQTAAAHVVSAPLFLRDGSAATKSTLTFAAQPGASGLWNVSALQNVVVS
jgi:hypothetical protein